MGAGNPGWNGLHPMYSADLLRIAGDASGVHAGSCLIVSLPTRRPATASLTRTTPCGFIRASNRGKPHARLSIVQIGFIGMTSSNQAFQA